VSPTVVVITEQKEVQLNMCGIAGFSMSPNSTVNVRSLAHELLSAIQFRGSDASGFAFTKGGTSGVYKNDQPGGQLPLSELPRRAETVILHTRYATQGAVTDNRNNHPVLSPEANIALVHNGVISNDYEFRANMGGEFSGLPAVDTAVIPALIEKYGLKAAVPMLEGYAAIAYLDDRDEDKRTLHLARLESSPVAFTWLLDGSFVFASTKGLLEGALLMAGLEYGHVFEMAEEMYLRVAGGIILESDDGYQMQENWYAQSRWASATAGGGGGKSAIATGGSENTYTGIGSSFGNVVFDDDNPNDDSSQGYFWNAETKTYDPVEEGWGQDYRSKVTTNADEIAMAYAEGETDANGDRRRVFIRNKDGELVEQNPDDDRDPDLQGYYIRLEDSSMDFFETIEELEDKLQWLSGLNLWDDCPFPDAERKQRWTNFVVDMGQITNSDGMESWLTDLAMVDTHESPNVYNLQYVRDGLSSIMSYVMS
jgi:hypothetical protein